MSENACCDILLVDDHPLLLEGLAAVIAGAAGLSVCGKAGDVREALTLVESLAPDLVITDLTLPGRGGLELVKDLAALRPGLPVLVFSMHDEMVYAERVLRAGGRGYVMKDVSPDRLLLAIRTVASGGAFASQNVTNRLLKALSGPHKTVSVAASPMDCLTDREIEVFELIGRAKGNHEIAGQLGISPRTLDAHRAHIREKLGLADGNELTRHAIRWFEAGMSGV